MTDWQPDDGGEISYRIQHFMISAYRMCFFVYEREKFIDGRPLKPEWLAYLYSRIVTSVSRCVVFLFFFGRLYITDITTEKIIEKNIKNQMSCIVRRTITIIENVNKMRFRANIYTIGYWKSSNPVQVQVVDFLFDFMVYTLLATSATNYDIFRFFIFDGQLCMDWAATFSCLSVF